MTFPDLVFYGVAAFTLASAAYAVLSRNIVRAVFSLLGTFFGVALVYGMLASDFVAVVQLMVYVGGILVLMLFAVMLTSQIEHAHRSNRSGNWAVGLLLAAAAGVLLCTAAVKTPWREQALVEPSGTTDAIGFALIGPALLPFLVMGLLLMAVVIGGVTLARKKRDGVGA